MKRFRFRFETVLAAKRHVEEQRQHELARRLAQQYRHEARLRDLQNRLERHRAQWRAEHGRSRSARALVMYEAYFRRLLADIDAQHERIREAAARVEAKRAELVEARKDVRILEKLRERDLAGFQRAVERWEQRSIDEVAVNQFLRQRRERVEAHA